MSQESATTQPEGGKQNLIAKWLGTSTGAKVAVVGALLIGLFLCCGLPTIGGGLWLLWPRNESKKGKDSAEERKSDHDLIQGTWKRVDGETRFVRLVFTVETVSMEFRDGNKNTHRYKLDPSKKPKTIDITLLEGGEKGTIMGIYAIEGDTLKMCLCNDLRVDRPTDFEDRPGKDPYLFKRENR